MAALPAPTIANSSYQLQCAIRPAYEGANTAATSASIGPLAQGFLQVFQVAKLTPTPQSDDGNFIYAQRAQQRSSWRAAPNTYRPTFKYRSPLRVPPYPHMPTRKAPEHMPASTRRFAANTSGKRTKQTQEAHNRRG